MPERTRKTALVEGITAGAFFGTASVFIRLLGGVNVFSIAFWRLIVAAIALALILMTLRKPFRLKLVQQNFRDLIILSIFLGLHFILFVSAVKDTTILNATVLVNTTPIVSMFISAFLFDARPSRLAVLGLAISFIGVCTIAIVDAQSFGFSVHLRGDMEATLAAVVEAFYLNLGRKTRSQMPLLATMLPIYLLTAVVVGILSVPAGAVLAFPSNAELILFLVGLGLLPTAISHTLYFSSLSNLKSFETATMALLEPIGATTLGVIIFKEIPGQLFIFGAFLILLGITFVARQRG